MNISKIFQNKANFFVGDFEKSLLINNQLYFFISLELTMRVFKNLLGLYFKLVIKFHAACTDVLLQTILTQDSNLTIQGIQEIYN